MKRALVLSNVFNLLIGVFFIIIAIISLVHLRWYHQLTVSLKARHIITNSTSYSAFLILIVESLILILVFITSTSKLHSKVYARNNQQHPGLSSNNQESVNLTTVTTSPPPPSPPPTTTNNETENILIDAAQQQTIAKQQSDKPLNPGSGNKQRLKFGQQTSIVEQKGSSASCLIFLHFISSVLLIIILVVWLMNTGELVRDSISMQLDAAYAKYQFANRSNHYSVAIDAMQDINYCCGSLDYTDFPHQRISGLSSGHYPGSCCGKHIFGVNARVLCVPEEILKAKQTSGCVQVLSSFYDLISILVVPGALICLFVSITTIALITISRGDSPIQISRSGFGGSPISRSRNRMELRTYS